MAFQAPRIIGGGQIITPQAQGNPFKGIEDAVVRSRDRKQKQELIDLERQSQWLQEWDPEAYSRKEWMQMGNEEKQPSFLDLAKDKIGYGEGQWAPGKLIKEGIGKGYRSVADMFGKNPSPPFDPEDPESIMKYQADNGLTVDGIAGPKTMEQVSQTSYSGPNPNEGVSPYAPDTSELPINKFNRLSEEYKDQNKEPGFFKKLGTKIGDTFSYRDEAAERGMTVDEYKQQLSESNKVGPQGVGPLQKTPESKYLKQLHGGTAQTQKRDPYGHGNVQKDTSGSTKENIFTKVADFLTRPSKKEYESATEQGKEMVKDLDLSDNDAVAEFQEAMGLEPDGIAGKNTIAVIRALQSGEHERSTSGISPRMKIIG